MAMKKRDRGQVVAIIEDWLQEGEGTECKVKRIWKQDGMIMASYEHVDDALLREIVHDLGGLGSGPNNRIAGYQTGQILLEKKKRFGSGTIGYS